MTIYHIHHIVPKHAGGTDQPSNLIKVTVAEHAAFHYERWVYFGDDRDRLAWLGLSGMIGKEEILLKLSKVCGQKSGRKRKERMDSDPVFRQEIIDNLAKSSKKGCEKRKELFETDQAYRKERLINLAKCQEKQRELFKTDPTFREKTLENFAKVREKGREKAVEKNKGSMWIYNPVLKVNKRIQKQDVIPDNWIRGRKMKF